ncbi:hypothetical protein D3C80_784990 [compost metagenome]
MPPKIVATLVGASAMLCFWLVYVFGLAGGEVYSLPGLLSDYFTPTIESLPLALWAATFLGGFLFRAKAPRVALILSIIAPTCGIAGVASELWPLQQGMGDLDQPESEEVWLFVPRLVAASFMLGITLLGLSIQLLVRAPRPQAQQRT